MNQEFSDVEKKLKSQIEHFKEEIQKIRTGRANPQIIEDISVDYFGAKTPVQSLGSVGVLDPQTLVVEPWDKNALEPIANAITRSQTGLQAIVDGDRVRVPFPPLSEERRNEFVRFVGKKAEETKVHIRQLRDDVMKDLQIQEREGKLSEDDHFRMKEKLEKLFKQYTETIDSLKEQKSKELTTI